MKKIMILGLLILVLIIGCTIPEGSTLTTDEKAGTVTITVESEDGIFVDETEISGTSLSDEEIIETWTIYQKIEFEKLPFEEQQEKINKGYFSTCDMVSDFCREYADITPGCDEYCMGRYATLDLGFDIKFLILAVLGFIIGYALGKKK